MRALTTFLLTLAVALSAEAQSGALPQAEEAYQNIDFDGVHTHATAALREGGHSRDELIRIYELLGVSASALGREDEARDYFVRMLGLDRDAQLDESVPPRLRDPYLEARGVWAARPGRLALEVNLDRAASALRVQLTDPSQMGARLMVYSRLEGEAQFQPHEGAAQSVTQVSVPGAAQADRVEYYVELLDQHRNIVLSEGTAFQPRTVGRERLAPGAAAPSGPSVFEEPAFWIVTVFVLAAAGAVTGALIADERSRIGAQTGVTIGID
jgi:hypothetical protein